MWVSRALTVEEMDPDAGVSLGDLYAGGQRWDEAKKCYEKVIVKVSSYAMLCNAMLCCEWHLI